MAGPWSRDDPARPYLLGRGRATGPRGRARRLPCRRGARSGPAWGEGMERGLCLRATLPGGQAGDRWSRASLELFAGTWPVPVLTRAPSESGCRPSFRSEWSREMGEGAGEHWRDFFRDVSSQLPNKMEGWVQGASSYSVYARTKPAAPVDARLAAPGWPRSTHTLAPRCMRETATDDPCVRRPGLVSAGSAADGSQGLWVPGTTSADKARERGGAGRSSKDRMRLPLDRCGELMRIPFRTETGPAGPPGRGRLDRKIARRHGVSWVARLAPPGPGTGGRRAPGGKRIATGAGLRPGPQAPSREPGWPGARSGPGTSSKCHGPHLSAGADVPC